MYQDLVEMEKKLDWTIMRKKAEVQDALGRTASVSVNFLLRGYQKVILRRLHAHYAFSYPIQSLDKHGSLKH
jgi:hypothetical protein